MENVELDLNLAEAVVKKAIAAGADEAEVVFTQGYESSVRLRKGEVELLKEAQPRAMSLRVYRDKRAAVVYTSDFTPDALTHIVGQALDLAMIADADPAGGLPDPADFARNWTQDGLEIWDPSVGDIPTEVKVELLKRSENTAYSVDERIKNTEGASFGARLSQFGLVNSLGFAGAYRTSQCSLSTSAMAEDKDGKKQIGEWFHSSHNFKALKKPEEIGKLAAQQALNKLGARKVASKKVPVIWNPQMASELLGVLSSTITGDVLERNATFLMGRQGQKIGSDLVTIVDDPTSPGLPATRPFDGEGVPTRRSVIFDKGVFGQFLFNAYTARKTGHRTTGSAYASIGSLPGVGCSNLYLEPGKSTPEEMIAGVEEGLYLTEMIGFGFNPVTGDFSRGAVGFWIENGKLSFPVAEINVAGNMADMLANISQVGNDLEFLFSVAAPTLRIDNLTVSGL